MSIADPQTDELPMEKAFRRALSIVPSVLPPQPLTLAAFGLAEGDPTLLALGDKVTFPLGVTQDPILGHSFPETFQ